MTDYETGFSEKAAERRAVQADRAKAADYIIQQWRDARVSLDDSQDLMRLAEDIRNGVHAR